MSDQFQQDIIKKIDDIKDERNIFQTGRVIRIRDYIIEAEGLEDVCFFEKVVIGNNTFGYINEIKENSVLISLVHQEEPVYVNDVVRATGEVLTASFSNDSVGHVVDIFGKDLMTGNYFETAEKVPIESPVTPIMDRTAVNRPMLTGIAGIDMLYPIGRGQRQLIIGDKKTGKTQIALDAIVNQRGSKTLCIYVAVGKTKKNVKEVYEELLKHGAMSYTVILAAFNNEKPPVLSLTPFVALSIAKQMMEIGIDVLVVIDDLKRQADVYREIALLSGKDPGRDAYPADIFYVHARMLEQGCQHKSGGSITILPIMETRGGDITDYIATNVISITDGQIVMSKENFDKGQKPAINYGLSVSRLGGAVQTKDMKKLGARIRRELLSYLETRDIYELVNMDEMGQELRDALLQGKGLLKKFNQGKFQLRSLEEMIETFDK